MMEVTRKWITSLANGWFVWIENDGMNVHGLDICENGAEIKDFDSLIERVTIDRKS